jgi:phage shock protein PspC (stress-responsive transcriptional regulator)
MGDMNEQSASTAGSTPGHQAGTTAAGSTGPRVSADQMRDVDRLRRSTTDRYVAGVAGGLGRHFDLDPTVIRVVLAVLAFFGGAGVLVYAAVWLFVPEDGQDRAPIEVGTDVRRIILIVAAVIALCIVFGTPWLGNGWGNGFPIPLLVIGLVGVALFATRSQRRRGDPHQPPPPWGTTTSHPTTGSSTYSSPAAPEGSTMTTPTTEETRVAHAQQPPAWMPPPVPAYVPPPRPRRTGIVLFWPTLALIAIALGTLGIFDTSSSVSISAYAALAVAITGVMLLVGAFVGRPGGLIALGLVACIALLVTSIIGAATGGHAGNREMRVVPTLAADLLPGYHVPNGTIELDLTQVTDKAALAGRAVDVGVNAGQITVWVPEGLNVHVTADIRYAGEVVVGQEQRGGLGMSVDKSLITSTTPGTPTLELDLHTRVGQIQVEQR